MQSSRRKVFHRCGTGPGMESFGSHPFTAIPGGHLQLAAAGFHPGLWVSTHGGLSAPTLMETESHAAFGVGFIESAPRPNLRTGSAGSDQAEYRRLRRNCPRKRERIETTARIRDALHRRGLAYGYHRRSMPQRANLQRRPFRPPFPIRDEFLRLRCAMPEY